MFFISQKGKSGGKHVDDKNSICLHDFGNTCPLMIACAELFFVSKMLDFVDLPWNADCFYADGEGKCFVLVLDSTCPRAARQEYGMVAGQSSFLT